MSFSILRTIAVFGPVPRSWQALLSRHRAVEGVTPDVCICNHDDPGARASFQAFVAFQTDLTQTAFVGCTAGAVGPVLDGGCDLTIPLSGGVDDLMAQLSAIDRRLVVVRSARASSFKLQRKLRQLQVDFDAIDTDLAQAKRLQQGLIQDRQHQFGESKLSLLLQEKMHIGGDMVGQFPVNETTVGFFAFDVVGHGVTAALLIARLTGMVLGATAGTNIALIKDGSNFIPRSPADAFESLNTLMFEELETNHYFTAVLGFFDHATGHVTFCQAGHPAPILIHKSGEMEMVGTGGLPIGLIPGAEFEDTEIQLSCCERLLIMSDGITETPNKNRSSQLSEVGLTMMLAKYHHMPALDLFDRLLADLKEFQGSQNFEDDLSAVMLDYRPDDANFETANRSPDTPSNSVAAE